ncbi:MAG: 2-C-methyl-D-erythritol 4-phosphate cytidylyltransferase [Anaerovoracaceae bacterium]
MYKKKKTAVIIAAAGLGKRMGSGIPKQYLKIHGEPILLKALRAFCQNEYVDYVFLVTNKNYIGQCEIMKKEYGLEKLVDIVEGGKERQDSVYRALQEINRIKPGVEYVLVHDGARPFVSQETINYIVEATAGVGAAVAAVPVKNSIRQGDYKASKNLERQNLYTVQTPQGFRKAVLMKAYEQAFYDGFYGTDDAGLVERLGHPVEIVMGKYDNIKITTKEDMPMESRVGTGYDVHQLVADRKLILGGVNIPHEKGLLGHSDADVLVHAIMDALLGAVGLGDIGRHFPDTDDEYEGISSLILLEKIKELIDEEYYTIGNVDVTLMAQEPKVAILIDDMEKNIAQALHVEQLKVNIKATTTEKLGFVGREEGIAAQAVCLLYR